MESRYIITSMERLFKLDAGQWRIDSSCSSNVMTRLVLDKSPIVNDTLYLYQLLDLITYLQKKKLSNILEGIIATLVLTSI